MSDDRKDGEDGEDKPDQYEMLKSQDLIEEIKECFDIFDKDKDGQINYQELGTLLRWLKFNPTERELKEYAALYDPTNTNLVNLKTVMKIVDGKLKDTDTIDELVEAMKLFDNDRDGKLLVPELRWALTKLGEMMDEGMVDEMVKEIDPENKGLVDIVEFAKACFNIKEKVEDKKEAPKKTDAKKKK
jgi:calmodulin